VIPRASEAKPLAAIVSAFRKIARSQRATVQALTTIGRCQVRTLPSSDAAS